MLHENITTGDVHYIQNWSVADTTARDALTVAPADVGKVCQVTGTSAYYILTDDSPMTWQLIGAGAGSGTVTNTGTLTSNQVVVGNGSSDIKILAAGTNGYVLTLSAGSPAWAAPTQCIPIACSDETTALTTGTAKVTFRMPYAFTLTAVRASVTTAPTGSTLNVDINEGGVSILSTVITIDASEKTSTTAVTPPVISDSSLADDAEITIDLDQVGSTIAGAGLKVYLIGYKT